MSILITILLAIFITEIIGYFLHRLLHSDKITWLSRSHMIHHLKDYGPRDKMRADKYLPGARGRTSVVGVGLEWLVPSIIVYGIGVFVMTLLGVYFGFQILGIIVSIGWAILMFNYMHDAMHLTKFWMLKIPIVRTWFKCTRRLHDIHHKHLSNVGRMDKNFGICFFFMDRFFNTLEKKVRPFNNYGYNRAYIRYKKVING